jgi:hypothetical protein
MATQGKRPENLEKFKNARSVFDTIFTGLKSHDESIKAASLTRLVGMMNTDGFFKSLYDQSAKQEASSEIAAIERAVDTVGSLSGPWKEYKDRRKKADQKDKEKKKREKAFKEEILPKYNAKLTTFIKETEKLFAEGGMNPEEIEDATKTAKELLKFLQEEETKK